jgi:Na+-driven multidrug efflux pump
MCHRFQRILHNRSVCLFAFISFRVQFNFACEGIPLGVYLTFEADMKLWGLWTGLTTALVYASVFGTYFCLKTDWNGEVKKALDRIKADKYGDQPVGLGA